MTQSSMVAWLVGLGGMLGSGALASLFGWAVQSFGIWLGWV